jgi:hypothetical protein
LKQQQQLLQVKLLNLQQQEWNSRPIPILMNPRPLPILMLLMLMLLMLLLLLLLLLLLFFCGCSTTPSSSFPCFFPATCAPPSCRRGQLLHPKTTGTCRSGG